MGQVHHFHDSNAPRRDYKLTRDPCAPISGHLFTSAPTPPAWSSCPAEGRCGQAFSAVALETQGAFAERT